MLVKNGTLYDLATTYSYLLEGKSYTRETLNIVANILNKGYTYDDVIEGILESFYNNTPFPYYKYQARVNKNLLKHTKDTRYFHPELNQRSGFTVSTYDPITCTITSTTPDFWIEPRASYTMDDLLEYFKAKVLYDPSQYSDNRLRKIFEGYINKLGIDITMFMIRQAIELKLSDRVEFTYSKFDEYQSAARQCLNKTKTRLSYDEEIGWNYVLRKRVLPDRNRT